MAQLLPLGLLLPLSIAAQAQQPDTLAARQIGVETVKQKNLPLAIKTPHRLINDCSFSIDTVADYSLNPYLPLQEQLRQVAGVQATPYSGAPGAGEVVRIRGAASIDNYVQPLYVVDGVPVFQYQFVSLSPADATAFSNAGFNPEAGSNPLLSIPSADVEQIEVLKGAYATGQYGFLGQNGVIRITTKRGKAAQPLRLRYTGYGGAQQARHRYDLLGAREIAEVANEAASNRGYTPPYSPAQLAAFGRGTDWQDELLRTAAVHEHHLSADGGTGFGTRYYLSADYLKQTGIVLNSGLQRYALRLNLDQQIGKRVQLSARLSHGETQVRQPVQSAFRQALPIALRTMPTLPVYASDDHYATDYGNPNPLQLLNQNYSTPRNRRLLAQAQAQVKLLAGLRLDLRASQERDVLRASDYESPYRDSSRIDGLETKTRYARYQQSLLNPALRFERTFGGRHAVEATAEASYWHRELRQQFTGFSRSSEPPFEKTGQPSYAEYTFEQRYHAYTLSASYTYAGRYTVAGSWQRNATPMLSTSLAQQWLPAAQATWHAGEETWLKDRTIISRLDTWVGVGKTSNRGNFAGDNRFTFRINDYGSTFFRLAEITTQHDAGLDVGFWQDRLTLSASVYRRKTEVQIGLLSPGFFDQAFILNRGLEATLSGNWQAGKVSGTASLAVAFNQNRYGKPANSQVLNYTPAPGYYVLRHGEALSSFIGRNYLGLDEQGNPQFQQLAGYGISEQELLGSGLPRQLASLTQTLRYGRLQLQMQLDGMFGYQVYDTNLNVLNVPTDGFNATTRVRDRWTPSNRGTEVPRAGTPTSAFSRPNSYALQSGNHVRLSSVTLTADVWQREQRSVAVFLSGTNLLVVSGYQGFDPNISSAEADPKQAGLDRGYYPTARTVLLGVRATL